MPRSSAQLLAGLALLTTSAFIAAADCEQLSQICAEPNETRVINGLAVTRACWRFEQRYRCATGETEEEPYCQELRDRSCSQVDSNCTERLADGTCTEYEQTYRCPSGDALEETVMNCGERVFCLDGDCFATGYAPNQDFALAASHLGAIEAAVDNFDVDAMVIFKGQNLQCKKTAFGFKNCCKDKGWGLDLGLAQCSESEVLLGEKREAGFCHYVGDYKKGRFLSKRKYQSFCCFNSKLARIIQEQGRPQLGLDWGSAEFADCRGLTPEELTRVDFARIDFSEFYADALAAAGLVTRPGESDLARTIEDRILRLLPQ
jgi:conjugal transfer mating pair stabilization protein TraN